MKEELNQIPPEIFWPFRSGVYGWGSICGALPPAICAIAMVADTKVNQQLINELMAWYKDFPFPEYQPAGMDLPTTVADSSLCHVSVTKWMQETGYDRSTPERSERCAGLSADVARYTVVLLNELADGTFVPRHFPSDDAASCMECHGTEVSPANGKESCTACHGDPHAD